MRIQRGGHHEKKEMFQNINGCMPLQRSEDCYVFREWSPSKTVENVDVVRAVYVLTTAPVDSTTQRLRDALAHLSTVSLSPTVFVVFNQTYKTCHKPELCHHTSIYDLDDANRHIAQHAQEHFPGESICIMEDDFMWTDASTVVPHLEHVRDFVEANAQDMDHYSLGSLPIPFTVYPAAWNLRHHRILQAGWAQSMLHTPRGLDKIVSRPRCTMDELADPGIDRLYFEQDVTYMYFRPLTVQLIAETENKKEWGKTVGAKLAVWHLVGHWKMDTEPRAGTYYVYVMAYLGPALVVAVFLAVLLAIPWKRQKR